MAQGEEELFAFASREVELPRRAVHHIGGNNAVHFFTKGLNRDCFPCQLPTFVALVMPGEVSVCQASLQGTLMFAEANASLACVL